jgi:hypothetical protein
MQTGLFYGCLWVRFFGGVEVVSSRFVSSGLSRYEDQKQGQEQFTASLLILPKA